MDRLIYLVDEGRDFLWEITLHISHSSASVGIPQSVSFNKPIARSTLADSLLGIETTHKYQFPQSTIGFKPITALMTDRFLSPHPKQHREHYIPLRKANLLHHSALLHVSRQYLPHSTQDLASHPPHHQRLKQHLQ